jgi:hypothetical protein
MLANSAPCCKTAAFGLGKTLRDKACGCSPKMMGRQMGNPVNIIATVVGRLFAVTRNVPQNRHFFSLLAERMGFEPMIRFRPYNGLANRRLQPLGHLSEQ